MTGLLIDERGRLWPEGSQALSLRLPVPERDRPAYAVAELGYVHIERWGQSLIVCFSPRLLRRAARLGAYYEIARQAAREVHLICVAGKRCWRECVSTAAAYRRIDEIVHVEEVREPRGVTSARLRLDALPRVAKGRLGPLWEAWKETGGRWTSEIYGLLDEKRLLDTALIVRNPARSNRLVIEHWGARRNLFGPEWIKRARGLDMEEQPYTALALWASNGLRSVIGEHEPRLDAIRVCISSPRNRVRRRQYERLTLPWRSPTGEAFAMSVNIFRPPLKWPLRRPETPSEP